MGWKSWVGRKLWFTNSSCKFPKEITSAQNFSFAPKFPHWAKMGNLQHQIMYSGKKFCNKTKFFNRLKLGERTPTSPATMPGRNWQAITPLLPWNHLSKTTWATLSLPVWSWTDEANAKTNRWTYMINTLQLQLTTIHQSQPRQESTMASSTTILGSRDQQ